MSSLLDALLGTDAKIVPESSSPASPASPDFGVAGDAGDVISRKVLAARCESPDRPLSTDPAADALVLLDRWKGYVFPGSRVAEVRELAERLLDLHEPGALLAGLRDFERNFIALGGEFDAELAEAVSMVERVFPGSRLIEIRRRLN